MTTQLLVLIGLAVTPFLTLRTFTVFEGKMFVAAMFSMAIFLNALRGGVRIQLKNNWILAFLMLVFLGNHFAPKINLEIWGQSFINPWSWKCYFYITSFFLLFLVVSGTEWTEKEIKSVLNVMVWAGTIMAAYVILQYFGFDQFFKFNKFLKEVPALETPNLFGTLGNSRAVAVFLAPISVLAFAGKKWIRLGIIGAVLVLINSKCAYLGVAVGLASLFFVRGWKSLFILIGVFLALMIGYEALGFQDSGRLGTWKTIVDAFRFSDFPIEGRRYSLLGYGMGSFPVMYSFPFKSVWAAAHNEFLEIMWDTGIMGIGLFIAGLGVFLGGSANKTEPSKTLLAAFLSILAMACWFFPFQIGTIAFYSVVIAGILAVWTEAERIPSETK